MKIKIDDQRFTFTEAALAAGVKPKTLRNWLDRGQIALDAEDEREGDGWRRFSFIDVLRIAFVSRLVDYCVPVRVASNLIEDTIISHAKNFRAFDNYPIRAISAAYMNTTYIMYEIGSDYVLKHEPGSFVDERTLQEITSNTCSYLTIIPGPIVAEIIENLGLDDHDPNETTGTAG